MSKSTNTLRMEQSLVARAFHTVQSADARRILLVSAHSGEGKTHFAQCIARHASTVTDEPIQVEVFATAPPLAERTHGYVWVDGVSLLEGQGAAALTPSVRASFDGALLVARGMVTTREQVANCADELSIRGVRVLGGVWNEFDCPPPAQTLRMLKAGLWRWPPPFPRRAFTRQTRRSS
ncbi:MAG: hypothetical protein WCB63_06180 [Polyangiales bacterium]